jgi:uncharacterized protein (TIGR03067 family)
MMHCVLRSQTLSVLLFVAAQVVPAAEPKPTPLGQCLLEQGYTKVPLQSENSGQLLFLPTTVCGQKAKLFLDTGSTDSLLTPALAKRAKLTLSEKYETRIGVGGKTSVRSARLSDYSIGGLTGPAIVVEVEDDPIVFDPKRGGVEADGLIGSAVLEAFSAVVDFSEPAVYLIEPWRKEKRLQGKWQAKAVVKAGEDLPAAAERTSLVIEQDKLTMRSGENEQKLKLVVGSLRQKPVNMSLESGEKDKNTVGVFEFDGDELRICLRQTKAEKEEDRFPKKFESTKENGFLLFTFTRVKEEKK